MHSTSCAKIVKKNASECNTFNTHALISDCKDLDQLDYNQIRRSTRRATIERRIWSQPRKDKIIHEDHKKSKRGRPKKNCEILKSALLNGESACAKKFRTITSDTFRIHSRKLSMQKEALNNAGEMVSLDNMKVEEDADDSTISERKDKTYVMSIDHEKPDSTENNCYSDESIACDAIDFSMPKICSDVKTSRECSDLPSGDDSSSEDSHVSLSEALEKLIDSSTSLTTETVTIHPVLPSISNLKLDSCASFNGSTPENPINLKTSPNRSSKLLDLNSTIRKEKECARSESDLSNDAGVSSGSSDCSQEAKSPLNLSRTAVKIASIKFPLKCPECTMRFCTVRSLLWHFGTHEKLLMKKDQLSNSLQDLAVEWNNPKQRVKIPLDINDAFETTDIIPSIYNTPPKSNQMDDMPEDLSYNREHKGNVILKVPTPRFKLQPQADDNAVNLPSTVVLTPKNGPVGCTNGEYLVANGDCQSSPKKDSDNKVTIIPLHKQEAKEPKIEKDDLVVINSNLALRIVSTSSSSKIGELTISTTSASTTSETNTITILPQNESTYVYKPPPPDILTIVPQPEKTSLQATPIQTVNGEVDPSQLVKLVLVPKTEDAEEDYDSEGSDCGMVIDVQEEEPSMDPLSLCAVTMDDDTKAVKEPTEDLKKPLRIDDEKYKNRKYVCQFCQKRFGWSTDLKRHIILHTGERPFKCKWCPINFTRKFLLQNHMKKIHPDVCKLSDLWE